MGCDDYLLQVRPSQQLSQEVRGVRWRGGPVRKHVWVCRKAVCIVCHQACCPLTCTLHKSTLQACAFRLNWEISRAACQNAAGMCNVHRAAALHAVEQHAKHSDFLMSSACLTPCSHVLQHAVVRLCTQFAKVGLAQDASMGTTPVQVWA